MATEATEFAEKPQDSGHIRALDGIRGAAVLMVFFYHALRAAVTPSSPFTAAIVFASKTGWIGVDLFFVLSGFLITTILLDARKAYNYFSVFYARRGLRIFPLYYAVVIFLLLVSGLHFTWFTLIFYWINISNLPTAFMKWVIPSMLHLWSLAIEEQFYLVWPAIVRRATFRKLAYLCIGIICGLFILRNLPPVLAASHRWPEFVYRFTPFRVDTLCGGALLAVLAQRRPEWLKNRGLLRAIFLVAGTIFFVSSAGRSYSLPSVVRFGYTSLILCFVSLVALSLFRDGWTSRIFTLSFLRQLGKYSYCFYLIHPQMLYYGICLEAPTQRAALLLTRHTLSANATVLLTLPIKFAAIWLVCAASWRFFEGPILKLKRHFRYAPRPEHYLA